MTGEARRALPPDFRGINIVNQEPLSGAAFPEPGGLPAAGEARKEPAATIREALLDSSNALVPGTMTEKAHDALAVLDSLLVYIKQLEGQVDDFNSLGKIERAGRKAAEARLEAAERERDELEMKLRMLADEAARAVTEPRRFHENEDNRQQALGFAIGVARSALAALAKFSELNNGAETPSGVGANPMTDVGEARTPQEGRLVLEIEVPDFNVDGAQEAADEFLDGDVLTVVIEEWMREEVGLTFVTIPGEKSMNHEFEIHARVGRIVGARISCD